MRKLFGNSSRGASGGRYVAGKQAERRSAPVQPDVQRPEADDEEIPLLRDYANREAAQHRAETEENDIPLLQQYLKRPPAVAGSCRRSGIRLRRSRSKDLRAARPGGTAAPESAGPAAGAERSRTPCAACRSAAAPPGGSQGRGPDA